MRFVAFSRFVETRVRISHRRANRVHCVYSYVFVLRQNGNASVITYSISRYSWNTSRRSASPSLRRMVPSFFIARDQLFSSLPVGEKSVSACLRSSTNTQKPTSRSSPLINRRSRASFLSTIVEQRGRECEMSITFHLDPDVSLSVK